MGSRARKGGIANAALKVARRAQVARNEHAHEVAQAVYMAACEAGGDRDAAVLAPVIVASELGAPGVALRLGLGNDADTLAHVAMFIMSGFVNGLVYSTRGDFDSWKKGLIVEDD